MLKACLRQDVATLRLPLGFVAGALALISLWGAAPVSAQWGGRVDGPPLMSWQRTLEDALWLSRDSDRPLLICVNNDGEPASDTLAANRYRTPEFAALADRFVLLLGAPVAHTDLDRDGLGRRVLCPRFGVVTCGEHIALEPQMYARWFNGYRIAPRHMGVVPGKSEGKDGRELFDLYLLNDLPRIDAALEQHGGKAPRARELSSLSAKDLLETTDAASRAALEARFLEADAAGRMEILQAAERRGAMPSADLLFLGLRAADGALRAQALAVLLDGKGWPVELLVEAAREAWGQRDALATLGKQLSALGTAGDARALRLATVLAEAQKQSGTLNTDAWQAALAGATAPAARVLDSDALYDQVGALSDQASATPNDGALRLSLARALLDLAEAQSAEGVDDVTFLYSEAYEAARWATELLPKESEPWALLALADWMEGGIEVAADAAARALPGLAGQATSQRVADVLDVLCQGRAAQLIEAMDGGLEWKPEWVRDVVAAAQLLAVHPAAADWQVAAAVDVVGALEIDGLHGTLARAAVLRFPGSAATHEQLRWHLLRDGDGTHVQAGYDALTAAATRGAASSMGWYSAYAALAAGDRLRSEARRSEAVSLYNESLSRFAAAGSRAAVESASFVALAHGGLARVALDEGRLADAAAELMTALTSAPQCLTLPDGNEVTPEETARELMLALRRAGDGKTADAVEQAMKGGRGEAGEG